MSDARERFAENPFHVLVLPPTATRAEVERAGQKWLAMLEVGVASARVYTTPVGPRVRTPELVRAAMAELRDPDRRITHELWCPSPSSDSNSDADSDADSHADSHADADSDPPPSFEVLRALAWQR